MYPCIPLIFGREQQPTAKERIAACGQPPVSTALIRSLSRAPLPWNISSFHHRWRSERCWFVQKLRVSNSRIYNHYLSCTVITYFLIIAIELKSANPTVETHTHFLSWAITYTSRRVTFTLHEPEGACRLMYIKWNSTSIQRFCIRWQHAVHRYIYVGA